MSIVRVNKKEGYSVIDNKPINDKQLSWEARGLLAYLLSKPDSWRISMTDLERQSPAGSRIIKRIIKELISFGYVNRGKKRNEKGRFEWFYNVFENPTTHTKTTDGATTDGATTDGKCSDIVSTDNIVNTDIVSTDNIYNVGDQRSPEILSDIKNAKEVKPAYMIDSVKDKKEDLPLKALFYLNEKAGRNLGATDANLRHLKARIKEGAGWDQIKAVLDYKAKEWIGTNQTINKKPAEFFYRPQTLFNSERFSMYLDEARLDYARTKNQPKQKVLTTLDYKSLHDESKYN